MADASRRTFCGPSRGRGRSARVAHVRLPKRWIIAVGYRALGAGKPRHRLQDVILVEGHVTGKTENNRLAVVDSGFPFARVSDERLSASDSHRRGEDGDECRADRHDAILPRSRHLALHGQPRGVTLGLST
jgi:hypothetical protein